MIYLVAAALICLGGAGGFGSFIISVSPEANRIRVPTWFWIPAAMPILLAVAVLVALIWVFVFLTRRPRAWGKLVCLVGFPWIMVSANAWLLAHLGGGFMFTPFDAVPGVAGLLLLCCAIALLIVDRGALVTYRPSAD